VPRYLAGEPSAAVDDDAGVGAGQGRGDRDLARDPPLGAHPERDARTLIAEHRLRPAREDGGHPLAEARDPAAADGVHAAVEGIEAAGGEAVLDSPRRQAPLQELSSRLG